MKKNFLVIVVGLIIVVGIGSFYGGMKYGQNRNGMDKFSPQNFNGGNFQGNRKNGAGAQKGLAFLNGEILSKDDKSVTIKLRDGGSQIIFFTASTTIGKITEGADSDLEVGKQITVNGATGSGGSVVAQSVQIR